jgi:RHS repeat-associated protein
MRTLVHEVGASVTWGYDLAYRLTNEERKSGGATVYRDTLTYDDVGNRTVYQKGSSLPTTYTYDAANQLETAVNGAARTTYTYDLNGNLEVENASGTLTTHTWNDENQLAQVAKTGMTTNQYTFNGDGQRVQIVDSQGTKKPIWDFENILVETDGSNVTQVVYTLEPAGYGNLISQRRSSTTSYYLFDALGSTRKLTGSASSITDSYDFRAYGETFASTVVNTNVFRWVGELGYYLDIDRLAYYLRARPYNPAIARFLSQDPIGFAGSPWNLFEYAQNAPTLNRDPKGLWCWCPCNPLNPRRAQLKFDCSCAGRDGSVVPEDGSAITNIKCGEWIDADGFSIHGKTYRVPGATCALISCSPFPSQIVKTETCITPFAKRFGGRPPYRWVYPLDRWPPKGGDQPIIDPNYDDPFAL